MFEHVKTRHRCPNVDVRSWLWWVLGGAEVRPKKYWGEVIRHNMAQRQLTEDMTLDRKLWRTGIRVEG